MYKILKAEKLAEKIFLMDVEAPRVARSCQPGEFVIVKMDEKGERIPLTICDFSLIFFRGEDFPFLPAVVQRSRISCSALHSDRPA